ncbi:Eukaryotic aspartyl protease family protein [Rhynchospora pubera]|uniref:Eukaryotic aspartyl protease family protein n=1 Tax=Rhynchospora pubera TaxID=906938 RepID=A0AAV8BTA4_9POAL|nr:Eukaryotic aspartyl protease family protein [Rhynchospora pubera]
MQMAHLLSPVLWFLALVLFLLIVVAPSAGAGIVEDNAFVVSLHELKFGADEFGFSSSTSAPQRPKTQKGATILELRHHSTLFKHKRHQNLLKMDEARATSIQAQIKNYNKFEEKKEFLPEAAQLPLSSGVKLQTLNYVTTITIGSTNTTVIVDTGSDLTWVQCTPCAACYTQQDPLFNPSSSPTYLSVPCNSTTCTTSLQAATGISGSCSQDRNSCFYALGYGDGSYTRGILAQETIALGDVQVPNFIFGCGRSNRGLFGGTSGLMGLGRTQLSLVSQTTDQFGGVFSYCLPTKLYNSSGSLVFGNDTSAFKNATPVSYTRMIADPTLAPFYFLNITGASVGGIPINASGFANGKILIDSGTVITRLPPSIYKSLKAEFVAQFSAYPSASGFSILDTCFNLSGYDEVRVPTLKLEFEGDVDVSVDVSGILYFVKKDGSQVCLALASLSYEDQVGIIGNYQQKNQRVVYDTVGSRLGFAKEPCSYS